MKAAFDRFDPWAFLSARDENFSNSSNFSRAGTQFSEVQHPHAGRAEAPLAREQDAKPTRQPAKVAKPAKVPAAEYESLATFPLVARVRTAWPWLAEKRPDLYRAVREADAAVGALEAGTPKHVEAVERLREAMEAASQAWEHRQQSETVLISSKLLDAELWIAADELAAAELYRDGVTLPILLPSEAEILAGMAEADARALMEALGKIQKIMPGSRLRSVVREGGDA